MTSNFSGVSSKILSTECLERLGYWVLHTVWTLDAFFEGLGPPLDLKLMMGGPELGFSKCYIAIQVKIRWKTSLNRKSQSRFFSPLINDPNRTFDHFDCIVHVFPFGNIAEPQSRLHCIKK